MLHYIRRLLRYPSDPPVPRRLRTSSGTHCYPGGPSSPPKLKFRGTVYSDSLGAVKKITRRWSSGDSFLERGLQWLPPDHTSPTASTSNGRRATQSARIPPQLYGPANNGESILPTHWPRTAKSVHSPHSPIPSVRLHTIPLQDILLESTPLDSWPSAGPEGSPPLGNLRATLSHQRVLAYCTNRDLIRSGRGASPTWVDSHQSMGAASWSHRSQPLRKRVQALRTLWAS